MQRGEVGAFKRAPRHIHTVGTHMALEEGHSLKSLISEDRMLSLGLKTKPSLGLAALPILFSDVPFPACPLSAAWLFITGDIYYTPGDRWYSQSGTR